MHSLVFFHSSPGLEIIRDDVELHEYFANDSVNLRLQGVRAVVESEHGRDNRTAELTSAEHVAQVNTPQRYLAGHQNDAPVLLEADIGGTKKQVFREAVGDTGQRSEERRVRKEC